MSIKADPDIKCFQIYKKLIRFKKFGKALSFSPNGAALRWPDSDVT